MDRMLNTTIIISFCFLSFFLSMGLCVAGSPAIEAFPQAKEGEVRHVIYLHDKERGEEDDFKVELIPGIQTKTDGVNAVRVGLFFEPVSLKGWGYTYYQVKGKDLVLTTMMAVPEGAEMVEKFVAGKSLMVRYNSRLPIVIYSKQGFDVRYRIWTGGELLKVAKED